MKANWLVFASLAAVPLVLLESFQGAPAAGDTPTATYARGVLHAAIPYHNARPGAGELTVDILDPEDHLVSHAVRHTEATAEGAWRQDLSVPHTLTTDELVWHRLRYRFAYDDHSAPVEGVESISRILRTPVVHILAQQSYLTGGEAAVRVVVTDTANAPIPGASTVRIELAPPNQPARLLYTGPLNRRGTTQAQFRFPAGVTGSFPLRYSVETPIGATDFTQSVRLEHKVGVLLTTEKPIYQPGQTIHIRALALDRANHEAAASSAITFEVEDSRANKVFKKVTQTDKFGVASAEFSLADEVNLGTYHLRALLGDSNTSEVALNVERYVLPKFKVAVELGGGKQPAHGYRPGDHVTGTVRANYFFGKAVDRAEVTLKASALDVAMVDVGNAKGTTDADGSWHFDFRLPTYFAGRPLSQGAARVLVEATVKDGAAHSETKGEPIMVSQSPLIVTAVPEGGSLIPGLDNQVFVLTSYADGKPARTSVRVHSAGNPDQTLTTDDGGVGIARIKPGNGHIVLDIDARDADGDRVDAAVPLDPKSGADQILLRTERAVYRAGERVQLKIYATKKTGTAYVDIVKEGQTVLTRDLDIVNGQAELALDATADLAGTLDCNAYLFGQDALPIADHRFVFVQPASELKIEATADAPVHKPGDDARIRFRVTNQRGEGVEAALGVQVVDEAVFALAEKQPGFAKVFFYLEQEAMKPRYEIHSIGMTDVVEQQANRDLAARALFSATEAVNRNRFETEIGRTPSQVKYGEYAGRYYNRFVDQIGGLTLAELKKEPRDAWGTAIRVQPVNAQMFMVRSAGLDKKFDSGDDLAVYVTVQKAAGVPTAGTMEIAIEHDRGPANGRAEIAGSVFDQNGVGIAGITIQARNRKTQSGGAGYFSISAVEPGDYEIAVSTPSLHLTPKKVTLSARDRVVVSVKVTTGSSAEKVAVVNGVRRGGFGGGGGGGVIGGIMMEDRPMFRNQQGQAGAQGMAIPAPPPPMAAAQPMAMDMVAVKAEKASFKDLGLFKSKETDTGGAAPAVHTRSYFPEALYINPEIITDRNGVASITIPLADSITTWRMALMASTARGALGSGSSSLKVFQDFFVDLDLPVTLTQGDRVSIPVAVYNYAAGAGDVSLQLQPDAWYSLSEDVAAKSLKVDSGRVGASQFTIQANRIGKFKLTLAAKMSGAGKGADIVVREIEVIPNGREQTVVFNGRLESSVKHDVAFPPNAIPDAGKVLVRLYPGPLSQVIEGMDSILRMPGGCFEQTSSSTYPNVLALDYMKRTKKLTPEVHAKAEGFIANGYQRLLTFEVAGGGFSWFGQAPANKILTSYGLMEFSDMAKVYDVDPRLIQRTQQWLAAQQQADGSWKPDTNFINEGATNRYNSDVLRITAYIAWALGNTGYQGPAIDKARQYVSAHMNGKPDAYTLAVVANFATDAAKDREFLKQAINQLLDARTEKDDQAWWTAEETAVYATGSSASVETTGLAVQALLKSGEASATASKALHYLASKKDATGAWGSTQATIMALRAILLSTEKGAADVRGTVEVTLNGRPAATLTLTPDNNDLLHQFVFAADAKAANTVEVRFNGKGGLAYQIAGRYFIPWTEKPAGEPLSIDITYDRTRLSQDDIATATANVKNNLTKNANMIMVDLGIPPGFDLLSEDLQTFQEQSAGKKSGRLEKFTQTATQAILYFNSLAPKETVTLKFRLRAKYPIRAKTFQSRVYEYYDPAVNSVARPVQLVTDARK